MKIRAHESFNLRKGWLHKGVKNIKLYPRLFHDKEINPCEKLGIGANMVKSLRYWMNAVGIMEEISQGGQRSQRLTELGEVIDRYDKFYEEEGTLWLLQYKLATNRDLATAWYWFFNIFKLNNFTKQDFTSGLADYLYFEFGAKSAPKVLEDEFSCLIRTYHSREKEADPEDTKECPLTELKLIEGSGDEYRKCVPDANAIHPLVAYAVIMAQNAKDEILIADLLDDAGNIGRIFNLDKNTLYRILESLQKAGYLTIARTAGMDVVRVVQRKDFIGAVKSYYNTINGTDDYE